VQAGVAGIGERWRRASRHAQETRLQRIDNLARRLVHPAARLAQQRRDSAALAFRLDRAYRGQLERGRAQIAALERSLAHLNPQAVLERGYAIVTTADGAIVHDAERLAIGEDVGLAFARGTAGARITRRGG
jgi:exodeoxyribonuclease VII large subunit